MLNKLLFVPSLIDFDVGRNSHHTLSCSVTERTPGSNLDAVGFLALPIAFGVRDTGVLPLVIESMTMKKVIIWTTILESEDLGMFFILLGLLSAPIQNDQAEEQVVTNQEDREDLKLAQLESYLKADDNQGLVDLSLYL